MMFPPSRSMTLPSWRPAASVQYGTATLSPSGSVTLPSMPSTASAQSGLVVQASAPSIASRSMPSVKSRPSSSMAMVSKCQPEFVEECACAKITPKPIFESHDYLTRFLGYCSHCLKVIVGGKDEFYTCDQCCADDSFDVCKQCLPLVRKIYPAYTFSKKISNEEVLHLTNNLNHFDTKCGNCMQTDFKGVRYRCKNNNVNCDLCEHCANKAFKQHSVNII
ncbi:unnamed protein product, partial [Adineta steineri]